MKNRLRVLFAILSLSLTACTEYWWTRGQAPSVQTLLTRSSAELSDQLKAHSEARKDIVQNASAIQTELTKALDVASDERNLPQFTDSLLKVRAQFFEIDPKLSIGSRAPFGELSGQLRVFIESSTQNVKIEYPAFGTFAARVMFFLANEMTVPAPVVTNPPTVAG